MSICCPTCGQDLPVGTVDVHGLSDGFPSLQKRIIDSLAAVYPKPVPIPRLINDLYFDDIDGGPDDPRSTIAVTVWKMRPKLEKFGWTIPKCGTGRGVIAQYRLERINEQT